MKSIIDLGGWLAAGLMLYAYVAVSCGRLDSAGRTFQWCNVSGGVGLSLSALRAGALPSAVLNIVWVVIGLVALTKLNRRRRPSISEVCSCGCDVGERPYALVDVN